jgi:hypothetical protein
MPGQLLLEQRAMKLQPTLQSCYSRAYYTANEKKSISVAGEDVYSYMNSLQVVTA